MSQGWAAPLWVWAVTATALLTSSSGRRGAVDSPPPLNFTFTRPAYHVTIPENSMGKTYATADERMGMFLPPRGEVHYKIVSGDADKIFKAEERVMGNFLFLLLRTRTGNSVVLNRERKDTFLLNIKATLTLDDRIVENSTIVTLNVSDRNDLRPLFFQTSYQVAVGEDARVHSSIVQIRAEDADLGIGGEVYYRLRDPSSNFVIHPVTGVVTLTRRLRYAEKRSYEVTVLAQDRGDILHSNPPSAAKLTVHVKPVNIHNPEIFVKHFQEAYETSDMNVYAIVTVVDKDEGRSGEIDRLEIVDGDSNGHFRIKRVHSSINNTFEYNIITYKILNRERYSKQYNLTLKAVDKGTPPRSSFLSVNVQVEPIYQKTPIFEKEIFEINIMENAPVNSPIIRLKMTDNDQTYHNEVHLEIVGGNEEGLFRINPQTGMLYTTAELDAENKNLYILTVSALEQGKSGFSMQSSAKVKINIVDINDNDPIFEVPLMNISVTENEPSGTVIGKVVAKDRDSGENGYISYSIANLNPVPFEIDHFTGVIRTIETLDYETMRRESLLYVRASDWGLPFRRQTEMELRIKLRDINDNKPQFERVNCSGSLSRYAPLGSEVMSLTAIDFDSGNIISYRIVSKNTEGCFNLDLTSGILSVACDLRYENFTERTLNTTATDGVHFSDINQIHIKIVNDKLPRGSHFDSDNFQCMETGVAKQLKDILASASKNNLAKSPDHRDISIMPKRYGENIHAPEILNLPGTVQVNESVPLGSKIIKIQAKDRDLGYNGKLVYGVISGDKDSLFRLDPDNGFLKTIGHLDYEKDTVYTLNIVVFDLGKPQKSSTGYLTVVVLDNNDNPPRFQQPMASIRISENTQNGTAIFKAIATDLDSTEFAQITYSLITDTNTFIIHPTTGVLYINGPLDREERNTFELRIQASDHNVRDSVSALNAESILLIYVDDVNDNAPSFMRETLTIKVKEDMPVGSVVAVLEAVDTDLGANGEVVYSTGGNQSFTVEPLSGAFRLTRPLDYEERQTHQVNVTACDRGTPVLCSFTMVTVRVVDVDENAHAPQFPDWAVSAAVAENLPAGAVVTRVNATDDDPPGEDSRLSYYIAGGDGVGYFSIDDQGVIRTTTMLDAESENHFWLTVFAQDHGLVPLRSRLEVYVSVTNVNDNVPLTVEPVYYPHVTENVAAHTSVAQLVAEDADLDLTPNITFEITAGNHEGFFEIDQHSGLLLTTRNKLDREYQAEHDLEIKVSDNGDPPLWSTTRVVVMVDDVNDHAPQFEQSFYQVLVPPTPRAHRDRDRHNTLQNEDDNNSDPTDPSWDQLHKPAAGEPLMRVLATDKDTGANADIEYSIKTGRGKGRFHIHPEMGTIYSHKPFSTGQEFELMVRATDHGFPNKSSTARIVVQVVATPEARGAPFVKQQQQRVEVTESDPVGFLVATIQPAHDADYLWFTIVDGNPRGEFVMGGDPGSVLLAKQLDCETQAGYNLTVVVSNGVHSVLTQVLVNVLDMNEHRPEFPEPELWASVSEAAGPGVVVATVRGTDADRGGSVVYDLHNAQSPASLALFSLDHETGQLTVTGPLDREHNVEHVMTIVAKDNGTPSKRNYARLRVRVEDSNNHAPQWSHRLIQGYVLETAERGSTVVNLLAIDKDRGENAQIRYSILSGNIGNTFEVHPSLGTLSLAGSVDSARLSEYMLTVQATDGGEPPLSNTVPVHILVISADEAAPRFSQQSIAVQIYENEGAGTLVQHLDVRASSSVFFEIRTGNDQHAFTVNPSTGSVTTLQPLDREQQQLYNLTVSATNAAGARAECSLVVHVLDRNDNPPQLHQVVYRGVVAEDAPVGSLVMTNATSPHPLIVLATDADTQSNALLWFKILETAAATMFYIDGFTGTIRTKTQLDFESMSSVSFTVRVFDLGEPQLASDVTASIYIAILDVNDCVPRFLDTEYNLSLLVPPYPDARLLQVEARDEDTAPVTRLRYMILAGNQDSWFVLHPETGELSVRGLLPPQPHPTHTLRIAVSDGRYSSQARVNIKWVDSGSAQLQFQHPVYQGYVTENSTKPVTVAVVSVVGEELNQHIRFRLANPTPLFHLGLTSGALVTTGVPFDREDKALFTIYVQAEYEDSEDTKQLIQTLVNITVVDVNDNCPVFMNTPYVTAVSVGSHKHTPLFQVLAVDLDEGDNGEVRYELTRGHGELFRVDRKTGEVSLKQALPAAQEAYIIIITAYDGGVTPCSTEASLVVKVVAETSPKFERQLYSVTVAESLPPHSLLPLRLVAEAPFGHPVTYSVLGDDSRFSIDVTTGALFTEEPLDYESSPVLEVHVRATDSLSGAAADTLVTVLLTDVNDCAPSFPQPWYNISLLESTPPGALVARIQAFDNDTGVSGAVQYSLSPPHGAVSVDPGDGSLYLQQPLDRELNSTFHLVLTATDGGLPRLSTTADISLHVVDVNDNPPTLERPTYRCRVSAEAAAGHLVTAVTAHDPDLDPLTYLIVAGNDHHTFHIYADTGLISVMNVLHLASPEPHVLNVSVSDGVHTRFCRVSVHVLLTDQHAPVFAAGQVEATVAENRPAGEYVATVTATDDDPGLHGRVTYSITTEYMRSFFKINPDTGVLVTERPLDRESHAMLEVVVAAVDGGGRADIATVRVTVTDANDNAPEFHFPEYHACIPANLTVESVFLKVKARDQDAGTAGSVEYSIYNLQSKRVKHLFGINPQTGSIVLLQSVAQHEGQHFQFFVRAADGGTPPLFADVAVEVYVMRAGETPPTFHRRDQRVFVVEDATPGTVVAQVRLVTPMPVQYRLLGSSQFAVDREGVVTLTSPLDREAVTSHTLGVLALRPPLTGFTEVYVSVVDVNDNPPRFQSAEYNVRVAENVAEGTSIVRVTAMDVDEGGAGEVRYSIASSVLTVDPYSGWVSVVTSLDREATPRHSILLTATDNGDPPLSSTALLHLDIVDYNDSPPVFSDTLYTVSVNESLAVGSAVVQVAASDPDGAGQDYYITGGDPSHRFSLRSTGQVVLAQPLDRELQDQYRLSVVVSDSKYVAATTVLIHVLDVNDNKPRCLQPVLHATVPEDVAPGSTILIVPAEDADLDVQLRYHLTGTNAAHFYFDQMTGELKTAVSLDRESVSQYSLVAHVQDRDTAGWECTSHVTVVVNDVNDNSPVFPSANYTAAVPVDSPPGTFVTILRAVDSDIGLNRRIRYSLDSESLSIDAASGLVQVAGPLDKARYSVVVTAADLGAPRLSATANLHVLVVDVNDHPPEFAARSHHALVSEAAAVGTEVTRLTAVSVEDGVRSPVVYSIIAGNEFGKFTIEPHSDKIVVAEPLDFEETRQYMLTVLATDGGEHPLSTHTAVNITVTDSNDNAPQFSQPSYSAEISELATPGDTVIQVSAADADSGSSGLVRYSLVGDRPSQFKLDPETGTIKLAASIDREKVDSYVLRVQARDSGSPTLSSIAVVHVSVTDANDNPPLFLQPNLTAILQEDKPAGWAVCQLVVTDADVFHNAAPFIFEILYDDSGGKFRIDSKGVLQTLTQFSRQSKDTFHLQVRVYDSGSPPLFSDSWITIKVIEESSFAPEVTPLRVTVVSYEDRWAGGELGQVKASDRDPYDSLGYELLPASSLFAIDPHLGVIEASSGLDAGRYLLNVSVTDGKFSRQVVVEVMVQPLWDSNLQHAVSLRLIGISPEQFLLNESENLIRTVESVTLRNASIVSIQKTSSKYLDVLLIIMGGLDLATAGDLLQSLGLAAAAPACSCRNGAKCRQRVAVSPDTQLAVRTDTTVFISPAHSFTLYCACALGFTGELCEERLPAVSECACSGAQTCRNPPCVAPSCSNNHSCFPPNMASGAAAWPQEIITIAAVAVGVVVLVALFVTYRRCHGERRPGKARRGHKPPGAVDKLDITEISGSYCQHDILAGISLNSLQRGNEQQQTNLDVIAEEPAPVVVTTSLQRDDDRDAGAVESYGFPSLRHPTLPDLQTFQLS